MYCLSFVRYRTYRLCFKIKLLPISIYSIVWNISALITSFYVANSEQCHAGCLLDEQCLSCAVSVRFRFSFVGSRLSSELGLGGEWPQEGTEIGYVANIKVFVTHSGARTARSLCYLCSKLLQINTTFFDIDNAINGYVNIEDFLFSVIAVFSWPSVVRA